MTQSRQQLEEQIGQLQRELEELTKSIPAHSMKASMLIRIEELEDDIAQLQAQLAKTATEEGKRD